jgi:hypothetical protein
LILYVLLNSRFGHNQKVYLRGAVAYWCGILILKLPSQPFFCLNLIRKAQQSHHFSVQLFKLINPQAGAAALVRV